MRVVLAIVGILVVAGAAYFLLRPGSQSVAQTGTTQAQTATNQATGGNMEALPYQSDKPVTKFAKPEQVIDHQHDYVAEMETTKGTLTIQLYADQAPKTVNSFVFLALHHYYDGIVFHRVIPGFVAQTGDPTGTGMGGPGYQFGLEVDKSLNYDKKGVVGMARTMDPNTNGSQFYITFGPTPNLNGQYTVFGQVTAGLDVLDKISPTEGPGAVSGDQRDKILSVKILAKAK
jgi:peptidylprolyl isomerase